MNFNTAWNLLMYYCDDTDTKKLISETISLLPEDVADFATDRCRFLSVGRDAYGMVFPGSIGVDPYTKRTRNVWLILLSENLKKKDAHSIVAHEIAHAWLQHDRMSPDVPRDCEVQAADLTKL